MVSLYVYSGVLCCITLSVPNLGSKPLVNGGTCYISQMLAIIKINYCAILFLPIGVLDSDPLMLGYMSCEL